jgi:hypothetical protein
MKEEIIKGEGISEKNKRLMGTKETKKKQNKEDEKLENKGKKNQNGGKEKRKQKEGFSPNGN